MQKNDHVNRVCDKVMGFGVAGKHTWLPVEAILNSTRLWLQLEADPICLIRRDGFLILSLQTEDVKTALKILTST